MMKVHIPPVTKQKNNCAMGKCTITTAQALEILQGHFTTYEGLRKYCKNKWPSAYTKLQRREGKDWYLFNEKMIIKIKKHLDSIKNDWISLEDASLAYQVSVPLLEKTVKKYHYKKKKAPGRGISLYKVVDILEAIDLDEL